ncbi:MAG TPA: DMT family transporter [Bacteroidales bacterium]|mgnify:CR=1 FL=1|nr:DMT family transporter [Bacteroidales bacterium]HPT02432.1 DMT family transporter [Bacteroidales bacterium]
MKINNAVFAGAMAICFAAVLWGLDGIVLTPRLYRLDITLVVFIFHALPFLIMNLFLFKEYKWLKYFTAGDVLWFSLLALLGGALGTLAIVKALFLVEFKTLSVVVLLQKFQPVFAIALAAFLLREKLRPNFVLWAALAVVAGYFLTFGFHLPDFKTGSNTMLAAGYSLLAAFSFGSSTVLSKKVLQKYSFATATFYRYGFTTLIMLFIAGFSGTLTGIGAVNGKEWLIFLIIAFTTGSGAIFLYYFGLMKIRAMLATICELCFPVSAVLFDYLFNGKVLNPLQWFSAIVMIFAILKLSLQKTE